MALTANAHLRVISTHFPMPHPLPIRRWSPPFYIKLRFPRRLSHRHHQQAPAEQRRHPSYIRKSSRDLHLCLAQNCCRSLTSQPHCGSRQTLIPRWNLSRDDPSNRIHVPRRLLARNPPTRPLLVPIARLPTRKRRPAAQLDAGTPLFFLDLDKN